MEVRYKLIWYNKKAKTLHLLKILALLGILERLQSKIQRITILKSGCLKAYIKKFIQEFTDKMTAAYVANLVHELEHTRLRPYGVTLV